MKVKEKSIKEACEDKEKEVEERRQRVDKVASILEGVKYKTQAERGEAILSFVKSKLSEEEIEFLANTMKPDYRSNHARSAGVF